MCQKGKTRWDSEWRWPPILKITALWWVANVQNLHTQKPRLIKIFKWKQTELHLFTYFIIIFANEAEKSVSLKTWNNLLMRLTIKKILAIRLSWSIIANQCPKSIRTGSLGSKMLVLVEFMLLTDFTPATLHAWHAYLHFSCVR